MKQTSSKDLMLIFLLASITALFTSIGPLNSFVIDISLFIMIIVLSGYSLMSLVYPEENALGILKKPLLIVMCSIFIAILISLILKISPLGLHFKDLTWFLSIITASITITSYIIRLTHFKPTKETEKVLEKQAPPSFRELWDMNLIIFTLLSLLMIITVLVDPLNKTPAWMLPGSLFVCLIPGYLLLEVMFPRNDDLELIERFALSSGSSLILTSIIGLIFNYTQWGIRLELILLVMAVISLLLCLMIFLRRKKLPLSQKIRIPKMEKLLSIFFIICIFVTVGAAAYTLLEPEDSQIKDEKTNLTSFYVTESNSNTSVNSINLVSGRDSILNMILVNQEGSTVNYGILVRVDDNILKQENITLKNNQKIVIPINFTAGIPGERNMEIILYKLPSQKPYKKKMVTLKVA
jgi:uncharacterized membrane protein